MAVCFFNTSALVKMIGVHGKKMLRQPIDFLSLTAYLKRDMSPTIYGRPQGSPLRSLRVPSWILHLVSSGGHRDIAPTRAFLFVSSVHFVAITSCISPFTAYYIRQRFQRSSGISSRNVSWSLCGRRANRP